MYYVKVYTPILLGTEPSPKHVFFIYIIIQGGQGIDADHNDFQSLSWPLELWELVTNLGADMACTGEKNRVIWGLANAQPPPRSTILSIQIFPEYSTWQADKRV